jgi:hypothetical protein
MRRVILCIVGACAAELWARLCVAAGLYLVQANAAGWAVYVLGGLAAAICACAAFDVFALWIKRSWRG